MRVKNLLLAIIIPLIAVAAIIAYFTVYPWVMIFLGIWLEPNPPKPEIAYGEFPFRLIYEINGQRRVIKDTIICEYDGVGMDEGRGKFRKWKDRLASGNQEILLLKVNDTKAIYFNTGSAEYYMGDLSEGVTYDNDVPVAYYCEKYRDGGIHYGSVPDDELLSEYHIKFISWEYTKPIKNKFPE